MGASGKWDLDPTGIQGVLKKVDGHATSFSTACNDVVTDFTNCANAIGASIVTKALSDFAAARGPELSAAGTRITHAFTGTVAAVTAYNNGNMAMAKNAQTEATSIT